MSELVGVNEELPQDVNPDETLDDVKPQDDEPEADDDE